MRDLRVFTSSTPVQILDNAASSAPANRSFVMSAIDGPVISTCKGPDSNDANYSPFMYATDDQSTDECVQFDNSNSNNKQSSFLTFIDDSTFPHELGQAIAQANDGVDAYPPQRCPEGETAVYFLHDTNGRKVAVFKPTTLPAANPLRSTVPQDAMALREVAASVLDRGFAGVPPTAMVFAQATMFDDADPTETDDELSLPKLGSLQCFVQGGQPAENFAPGRFSAADVHRIGILDIRTHNTDRHAGNILAVKRSAPKADGIQLDLVPIDHALCFPTAFGEASWEWLYWPQAKKPFDAETLRAIEEIDVDRDTELLRAAGLDEAALRVHKLSTLVLKRGALGGLTLYEIARLCMPKRCRDKEDAIPIERAYYNAAEEIGAPVESTTNHPLLWDYVKFEIETLVKKPTPATCSFM